MLSVLRWRVIPAIYGFFRLDFWDEECEMGYRKEMWYNSKVCAAQCRLRPCRDIPTMTTNQSSIKTLAFYSGIFFVFNWILACAIVPHPWTIADMVSA